MPTMKLRSSLFFVLFALGFAAHAQHTMPAAGEPDNETEAVENVSAALPGQELTGDIIYQLLLAEIAGSRGNLALSASTYADLAQTTRDPRIAKRAAEIAFFGRQLDAALQATELWFEIDPGSSQAQQMLINLLIAGNRSDALAAHLAKMLALDTAHVGETLLQLNRLLARYPDNLARQALIEQVTQPYLGLAEAHFARAHAAQMAGNEAQALAALNRASELRPDWDQPVLFKAHLQHKNPAEAVATLQRYLDAHPASRDVRSGYARALVGAKRYEDARREFRTLLESNRDDADIIYALAVLSLQLGDRAQAESQFRRLIDMNYADVNQVRLQLGQLAEDGKRLPEAVQWYDAVDPGEQFLAAQARAAQLLAQQGRLDEASQRLQKAAAIYPKERAQFLVSQSMLLRDAGRKADAYALLDAALLETPEQTELLYEAALLAEQLGKNDVLERNLRKVIQINPGSAHAYNALGYSLADHNERLDEAQLLIEKALALSPEDPFIIDSRGWLLYRRGDYTQALAVLRSAFAIRSDPEIAAHIGEVLWALGRHAEAQRTLSDAAKASPGNEALNATIKKLQ
jgi:tetratricopeptide (TPR) repeat protein